MPMLPSPMRVQHTATPSDVLHSALSRIRLVSLTLLGKLVVAAVLAASGYGAWYYFRGTPASPGATVTPPPRSAAAGGSGPDIRIGIAYGTEKQRWLQSAVEQFAQSPQGRGIRIELIPMGSIEAAQALGRGDERIHAWSPQRKSHAPATRIPMYTRSTS
jgi:hypothetical protein